MNKLTNSLQNTTFLKGGIVLFFCNFLAGFLNYFFNILTAKVLGPEGYGEITAFFSYLVILSTPVVILSTYLIVKIGDKNDQYTYILSILHWFIEKIKKWWYFCLFSLIILPFLPSLTNLSPLTAYSIIPILVLAYVLAFYDGALQGLHLVSTFAILGIILTLVKLLGPISALYIGPYKNIIILFIFLSLFTKLIVSHLILSNKFHLNKSKIQSLKIRFVDVFRDRSLLLTAISSMSVGFLGNIDIIYVKKMFSAEDAGIYSSWSLFAKIIMFILGPLLSLSFIFFSSKKHKIHHQIFFIGSFVLFIVAGIVSLFIYGLYAKEIIDIFQFGRKFYPVVPFLEWASFFGTGYIMVCFMNSYFLAKKSNYAYILAISLPFYFLLLFTFGKELSSVMLVNIIYCFSVLSVYLLLYFKSRLIVLFQN